MKYKKEHKGCQGVEDENRNKGEDEDEGMEYKKE